MTMKQSEKERSALIMGHRLSLDSTDMRSGPAYSMAQAVAFLRQLRPDCKLMKTLSPNDLDGLKEITLSEMKPGEVYRGRVLTLKNVEPPRGYEFEDSDFYKPIPMSVALLVQDNNKELARAFVYNYAWPKMMDDYGDGEPMDKELRMKLHKGCQLSVVDPQIQTAADGKIAITVYENLVVKPKDKDEQKQCARCGIVSMQHCAKCMDTFYCSRACQEKDWKEFKHPLVCKTLNPKKALKDAPAVKLPWSVYRLIELAYSDLCPAQEHRAVRVDYGFFNCRGREEEGKLLGLYQGMIKIARVDIIKLHQACIGGQLAQFIKSSFEKYPAEQRGAYYPWFLQRQHLVKNPYPLPDL